MLQWFPFSSEIASWYKFTDFETHYMIIGTMMWTFEFICNFVSPDKPKGKCGVPRWDLLWTWTKTRVLKATQNSIFVFHCFVFFVFSSLVECQSWAFTAEDKTTHTPLFCVTNSIFLKLYFHLNSLLVKYTFISINCLSVLLIVFTNIYEFSSIHSHRHRLRRSWYGM